MGDHHVPRHGASTADILPLARQCLRGSPCVAAARFQRDRVLHQRLGAQRDTHLPRHNGGVPVPASLRTLVGRAQTAWLTQQRVAQVCSLAPTSHERRGMMITSPLPPPLQLGVPRSRVGDRRQPARPHHHADDRLFLVRPRVAAAREARPLRDGGPAGRTAGGRLGWRAREGARGPGCPSNAVSVVADPHRPPHLPSHPLTGDHVTGR